VALARRYARGFTALRSKTVALVALSFAVFAPLAKAHGEGEPSPSQAETEPAESEATRTIIVRGERDPDGLERQRRLDQQTPGFATAIVIDPLSGATPSDGLPTVLSRAPGVRVQSLGGLGQFSAVQIRGSSAQQVQVYLDGVPLGDSMFGVVDLSTEPLDGLDRIEVFRGYVPIAFGGATLGGAVNLASRAPASQPTWFGSAGVGAFSTREARVGGTTPLGKRPWSFGAQLSYAGSEGDFTFFDNNATPNSPEDDRTVRRRNNDYDRVFGQVRFDGSPGRLRVSQQLRGAFREQGVPGTATVQSTDARQSFATLRSITRIAAEGPRHQIVWILGLTAGQRHFRDPIGQVGVGVDDERSWSFDGLLSPRLKIALWHGASLGLVGDFRGEHIEIDEQDPPEGRNVLTSGDAARTRMSYSLGAEIEQRLFGEIWTFVPAVRIDALDNRFQVPFGEGETGDQGTDASRVFVSPRLGTKIAFVRSAQLRGSVGRYFRPPTLFELFGDRGYVVGNEGLEAESGWGVDGGFVYDLTERRVSFYAQLAGFGTWTENLIQFVRSGPVIRPINVAGARQIGVETAFALRLFDRVFEVDGSYTFLDSRNLTTEPEQHGKALPGRARHDGWLRAGGGYAWGHGLRRIEPRIAYELDAISEVALDPSGRYRIPARWLHSLVGELHWAQGVHLGVEVRNLADLRKTDIVPTAGPPIPYPEAISDFILYPLPGRSFFVRLTIDSGLPLHRKHH